uniref:DUF6589 domain-containing protein n=1 Tax=Psilocybe cubensis TaxID=181762 RepID=A0A8H7Y8R3_PSICU
MRKPKLSSRTDSNPFLDPDTSNKVVVVKKRTGTLYQLSESARLLARKIAATGLFSTDYDNVNMRMHNTEQIIGRHDSQENGTCATLIPLFDAKIEDLNLQKFQLSFLEAPILQIQEILLNSDEQKSLKANLVHTILRIIINHGGPGFQRFTKELAKSQPQTPDIIPLHKTNLHPLPTWPIDESTITGNADVVTAIMQELDLVDSQGKPKNPDASNQVRFLGGDQLSLARLRALEYIRAGQESGLEGYFWGVWIPDKYCANVTTWQALYHHAEMILEKYANSLIVEELRDQRNEEMDMSDEENKKPTQGDMVFENASLFLRDALITREFNDAIKSGDSGRIILVLKTWALSFRGSGRTKYAHEMLHLIHNLTHVWPKAIRVFVSDIVLKNWVLNPSGEPNRFVEMDLVQEHLNFRIKVLYKAKGSNASWEWLEIISPCVVALSDLQKMLNDTLGSDQGTKHAPPDLTNDIRSLMESLSDHEVYTIKKGRSLNDDEMVKDVISVGLQNLTTGSKNPLSDYNNSFKKLQKRRKMNPVSADETDNERDIPAHPTSIKSEPLDIQIVPNAVSTSSVYSNHASASDSMGESSMQGFGDDMEVEESAEEADNSEEVEETLPRATERDVDLDMDLEEIEEEYDVIEDSEDSEFEGEGDG